MPISRDSGYLQRPVDEWHVQPSKIRLKEVMLLIESEKMLNVQAVHYTK